MSSNSSPTSTRQSTPVDETSAVLTPSRKVKALLAQFSDSESEDDIENVPKRGSGVVAKKTSEASESDDHQDDDEDEALPRSRLTARLFGGQTGHRLPTAQEGQAARRTEHTVSQPDPQSDVVPENNTGVLDSSDDEIVSAMPVRKRQSTPRVGDSAGTIRRVEERLRSESPLFFPSPSATRASVSPQSVHQQVSTSGSPARTTGSGRSKFLALVDKHRKERIAREAAEIAKRAAGVRDSDSTPRRARGSSPADDSSEGNASADDAAIKRIQKQARPTRKASKKALEEMNRETQRMNRSMQLAHQATTKKKITKESLLARFNFSTGTLPGNEPSSKAQNSTASSSAAASDADSTERNNATPPTSPMRASEQEGYETKAPGVKDVTHLLAIGEVTVEMHGALAANDEAPTHDEMLDVSAMTIGMKEWTRYFKSDVTVQSPNSNKAPAPFARPVHTGEVLAVIPKLVPTKFSLTRATLKKSDGSESDNDEIEIVRDQGLKRKYAIFEGLTRRKAKEMPSHLALRTLAHLADNGNQKRSVNAAELEVDLRRKARIQALEERRQRLDELRAKGIVVQTAEERERDQLEVEDLVERARQEAVEIQKREKQTAKKDGTYFKDGLDDDEDESEDSDFEEREDSQASESAEEDGEDEEVVEGSEEQTHDPCLSAEKAKGGVPEDDYVADQDEEQTDQSEPEEAAIQQRGSRLARYTHIISDDEDDESGPSPILPTPELPTRAKTPHTMPRSLRKTIPGLQMSDDLPMELSQAFAATMAESQSQFQSQEQDSLDLTTDLPSPAFAPLPALQHFDSVDLISDSQPSASQTQPLNVELMSQTQVIPESPRGLGIHGGTQHTPSQRYIPFDLTQDNGYVFSPFTGNRFAETPILDAPNSTVETVILPAGIEQSPLLQRRGRLQRGRAQLQEDDTGDAQPQTAYHVMKQAAKDSGALQMFSKKKSNARNIVDDAAEESEDEYAGLGGASDDSGDDEENDDDRQMIDQDTEVGKGDEAKLAGLFADRERERDEKAVSKLLKDITTGALRRKRGVGDDLDLSDEEDAAARRREAKRREFARMRRELLKDEAVGKIAEDKKKEAFLRSIEDHDEAEADDDAEDDEVAPDSESQSQSQALNKSAESQREFSSALATASDSQINRLASVIGRRNPNFNRKPATLAEIRDSVSFLIEEPESQSAMVDLGLSDSEEEPEAYVDLDRHFREAEADENRLDEETDDLGGFVIDDDELPTGQYSADGLFKKPELPRQERAPFTERRTKHNDVVDRLSLLRQASSASSTASTGSTSTKMAFLSSKTGSNLAGVPSLLRRATTNSSLGSMSGRDNVSATGVVTSKTERGDAGAEKDFIRKGNGGRRNAVNFQADRKTLREEKMSARAGIKKAGKAKKSHGFLGGLFRGDTWD